MFGWFSCPSPSEGRLGCGIWSTNSPLAELKETHLAPLAQTFGRSTSTSTIKADAAEETPTSTRRPSLASQGSNGISKRPPLLRQ